MINIRDKVFTVNCWGTRRPTAVIYATSWCVIDYEKSLKSAKSKRRKKLVRKTEMAIALAYKWKCWFWYEIWLWPLEVIHMLDIMGYWWYRIVYNTARSTGLYTDLLSSVGWGNRSCHLSRTRGLRHDYSWPCACVSTQIGDASHFTQRDNSTILQRKKTNQKIDLNIVKL